MHELERVTSLLGFERAAEGLLTPATRDYYAGGAEDGRTLAANRAAFGRWALRPRVLVDVERVDASVDLPGGTAALPALVAPMGFQRLAHPDGELAMARAAAAAGTVMIASTLSTHTIEDIVAAASGAPVWLQLYVFRDRGLTAELVARAAAAGCTAICLTVDVPVQGNREHDARNRFALPDDLEIANFAGHRQRDLPHVDASGLGEFIATEFDPSLDWSALEWLRSICDLPIVVKGILRGDDARLAVERGADAIVVSNHGGRQLDGALASLDALVDVAAAVDGRFPLLMDGGVRRGTDVLKAVALGARAVLVGRPLLWALALAGEAGVTHALGLLRAEIERDLRLVGSTSIAGVGGDLVTKAEAIR